MTLKQKIGLGILAVFVLAAIAGAWAYLRWRSQRFIVLQGAIMVDDTDPHKERPVAGVEVTATDRTQMIAVKSDPSGLFLIPLKEGTRRGAPITLQFKHADYRDLELKEFVGNKLYIMVQFWPGSELSIGGLMTKAVSAKIYGTNTSVKCEQSDFRLRLTGLPATPPDSMVSVIEVEFAEPPIQDNMAVRRTRMRGMVGV